MSKKKKWYYAVAKGRETGIYETWEECKSNVHGFSGAIFKKFDNVYDAQDFICRVNNAV